MKIHLDKIGSDGHELDETLKPEWLNGALGEKSPFRAKEDGHLVASMYRLDEEAVHVRGRLTVKVTGQCSRCLSETFLELDAPMEVTLFPAGKEPKPGEDGELQDDDMGIATYADKMIDLAGVVRDEVFLELPMSPVCRDQCLGMCSQCGTNLNESTCGCKPPTDLRWEQLRRFQMN